MDELHSQAESDLEEDSLPLQEQEFSELVRYTGVGYVGGLLLGLALDALGFQASGLGQALGPLPPGLRLTVWPLSKAIIGGQ